MQFLYSLGRADEPLNAITDGGNTEATKPQQQAIVTGGPVAIGAEQV
ncbi:MAG: hypothetical protein JSR66_20445 [Proteobacteria bacterium]|nr:hypothetical protein [Pseudomonadota bacterium]